MVWSLTQKSKIEQTLYVIFFQYYGLLIPHNICQYLCYFSNILVPETTKENIADIPCCVFHYYGLLFPQILIYWWRINIRQYMLSHPVFTQHYNSLIQRSRRWKQYQTFHFRFPLVDIWLNIKEVTRGIADNYVSTYVIFQMVWSL